MLEYVLPSMLEFYGLIRLKTLLHNIGSMSKDGKRVPTPCLMQKIDNASLWRIRSFSWRIIRNFAVVPTHTLSQFNTILNRPIACIYGQQFIC